MTVIAISERAKRDRERYHPANPADYASSIGMPVEDDKGNFIGYACVGCWWCEGKLGKDIEIRPEAVASANNHQNEEQHG